MELYLVRHADALPVSVAGVRSDVERPLSGQGRRTARRVGEKLTDLGVGLRRIGCSPLMRAVQTAEILATATGYMDAIDCLPFLAEPRSWRTHLPALLDPEAASVDGSPLALVGHNPDIGDMVTHLLELPDGSFPFPPCTVVRVDFSPTGEARLGWWLEARDLHLHRRL